MCPDPVEQTACCIVGAGPAGALLSLLLSRKGIRVTLLEGHKDFDREFRGDTLHPSAMEIMEEIGLADSLLLLPHTKLHQLTLQTKTDSFTMVDFSVLKTRFPYIALMPQAQFLKFITEHAQKYPGFALLMGTHARELIMENGICRGVRYQDPNGEEHELRALLTVAADGRFSRLRKLAGLEPVKSSPPMDVLWFRLPRYPGDTLGFSGRVGQGHMLAILPREDHYQLGYIILKGSHHLLREEGMEKFHESLLFLAPEFTDRMSSLQGWGQLSVLSVESSCLTQWYKAGLLFIGDAAHVMSPVGGVGINYAIQDAVAAANVVTGPLRRGQVTESDLSKVQDQRYFATRVIQVFQTFIQNTVIKTALNPAATFRPPALFRLPLLRALPARLIGFGIRKVHLDAN
jgi:2-polyprenyl-6-methoxyphenol hydroxylase-like FAD-dependent oxidoreductase